MSRLGVFTFDFRFYYNVIHLLKHWKIPFTSIDSTLDIPDDIPVILSSIGDEDINYQQIKTKEPISAIRKAMPYLLEKRAFQCTYIGIDPGPKPGVAVLSDRILIEAFEVSDISTVGVEISKIKRDYLTDLMIIRIGNGDMPNREKILTQLYSLNLPINIVDENGTSKPHKTHDNILSAARIANIEFFHKDAINVREHRDRNSQLEKEFMTIKNFC
jgi:hypothetical protein